jgi:hypothetical protein
MVALEMILVIACAKKEEPKKDDFLGTTKTEKPKKSESRIHVIDDSRNTLYEIIEVDGHEYLTSYHGGIIHLESCPCKKKL